MSGPVAVAELGSGSGRKTRWILEAFCRRQRTSYYPIEISHSALVMCERELGDIDAISIVGFEREYLDGLLEVAAVAGSGSSLCVLFLGSTIGNFDRDAADEVSGAGPQHSSARRRYAARDGPGEAGSNCFGAYDDELGVTAAFNLNLLVRVNRELDADFDLAQFKHVAKINPDMRSVEMHLESKQRQTVHIPAAGVVGGVSRRRNNLDREQPQILAGRNSRDGATRPGFRCDVQWIDEQWPFAENLLIAE